MQASRILTIVSLLDRLNETLLQSKKIEAWLWEWVKIEGFKITGQCQHTGRCCKKIMIYTQSRAIQTQKEFIQFQENKNPLPFIPNYNQKNPEKIDSFDCQNLSQHNTCKDYQNRPLACKNYPQSNILSETPLYEGCGYRIQSSSPPKWAHPKLIQKIKALQKKLEL